MSKVCEKINLLLIHVIDFRCFYFFPLESTFVSLARFGAVSSAVHSFASALGPAPRSMIRFCFSAGIYWLKANNGNNNAGWAFSRSLEVRTPSQYLHSINKTMLSAEEPISAERKAGKSEKYKKNDIFNDRDQPTVTCHDAFLLLFSFCSGFAASLFRII